MQRGAAAFEAVLSSYTSEWGIAVAARSSYCVRGEKCSPDGELGCCLLIVRQLAVHLRQAQMPQARSLALAIQTGLQSVLSRLLSHPGLLSAWMPCMPYIQTELASAQASQSGAKPAPDTKTSGSVHMPI